MKQTYLLIILMAFTCHTAFAQTTAIPDPIFETFLEANSMGNGITNDQLVTTANIATVSTLNVQNLNISDLTGIEDFTSLTALFADGNALQSLDLSNLTNLNFVTLHDNQLVSLDISNNPSLGSLTAWNNGLTSIDITGCVALTELYLQDNMLTSINLSLFPNLNAINVSNNQLTTLNIKNGTNNTRLNYSSAVSTTGNPNLECITVDVAAYSYATWANIDTTTSFSVDCNATTYVPDSLFEGYLETHDASGGIVPINDPTSMGNGIDGDNYVKTPRIETVTTLNIPMLNIADLTGIEGFAALETLTCFLNQLTELDVTSNVNLQVLAAGNNSITHLNLKNNIALQSLSLDNNTINELDLSNNALLTSVSVADNGLIALDMKNGTNGNVSTFFSTGNPDLTCINVDNAAAAILSSWNKDTTTIFEVGCNETYIPDTSFENYLETHTAAGNTVSVGDPTSMGNGTDGDGIVYTTRIENVTGLSMPFKGIVNLIGIEDFTALETLSFPFNDVVEIDLSYNLALTSLNALTNNLIAIDVSNNINLTSLSISSNDIQSLDVSSNSALTYIAVANNELTFLNLQNGNNGNVTNFFANQNSGLTCINVDDETASYLNNTSIWVKDTAANYSIRCDETYILDPTFEDYLETHNAAGATVPLNDPSSMGNGIDGDNYVLTANINTVTNLNVASMGISDFTGIEDFVGLTSLNITSNTNSSIDVSNLLLLETLSAHSSSSITAVNVTGLTNLTFLRVNNTGITNLDISTNVSLERLWAFNLPNISGMIDITNNPLIWQLVISGSGLTGALDASHLTNLTYLECRNNDFSDLSVNNGNNNNITFFNATGNPNLTCIHVDDETASYLTNTSIWDKDPTAAYSIHCDETYILDPTFEGYLETHNAAGELVPLNDPTSMGNGNLSDNYVTTANINTVTSLDVSSLGIADLTGIEGFTVLETLICFSNNLDALDISENTALKTVICYDNSLTELDLSTNVNLVTLVASNNSITSLNADACVLLEQLIVSSNNLDTLTVANGNNDHMSFDATGNPNLSCINVDDGNAYYLMNWGKDTDAIFSAHCYETYVPDAIFENYLETNNMGNGIAGDNYVLTSNISGIVTLNINDLNIANLTGIEAFIALETLSCDRNNLIELNLNENTALTTLNCYNNQLTELDLSKNTALEFLDANTNTITAIDLELNTALKEINLDGNDLTVLNLDTCVALEKLTVDSNNLNELNIINGNNGSIMEFSATANPNLTCINVDDPTQSYLNSWNLNVDGSTSFGQHCYETYVPDNNFENYLETHNTAGELVPLNDPSSMGNGIALDDYVTTANINTVTSLNIPGKSISNLIGLEDFTALEDLDCNSNNIMALDVSENTALKTLVCNINSLSTLDISGNINLEHLNISDTTISELDLSTNVALNYLDCQSNQLTSLDISNNPLLTSVFAGNNTISTVTFGANTVLETLSLNNNSLTTVDLSQLIGLENLYLANNSLTSLNLISNTNLFIVSVEENALTELDVRNGTSGQITAFTAQTNPNLTCISVDDATASHLNDWIIDVGTASFAEQCNETYVSGINFEIYLETHNAAGELVPLNDPSSMGNGIGGDNYVKTNRISNITTLDISSFNITDVTGIEDFIALESFICNNNAITMLDISENTALTNLVCNNNQLTALDISTNINLEVLQASQNGIGAIDLEQNVALKEIYLQGTSLTSLNLDPCVVLEVLDVTYNSLQTLSIKNGNNANITQFNAGANPPLSCINVDDETASYLTSIPWRKDAETIFSEHCGETYVPDAIFEEYLETHNASGGIVPLNDPSSMGNGIEGDQYVLTSRISGVTALSMNQLNISSLIGIEDFTALESLICYDNNLNTLDISENTALTTLVCYRNNLTELDISENTALTTLVCYFNQLTELDITANTNLEIIEAGENQLTTLDVHLNTALKRIAVYNNNLTALSVDACIALEVLDVEGNDLVELRVVNGNNAAITSFDATNNPNLMCISVDDPTQSYLSSWILNVDGSTSFGEHCNETQVPDAIFENYLETHDADRNVVAIGDPKSMGNGVDNDGYVSTLSIQSVTNLRVYNLDIVELTGIEDFTALTNLNCSRNLLTSLDVSQNVLLTDLSFSDNQITTIDLSQNTLLEYVSASENQLTSLDVSNSPLMDEFDCSENLLTNLNINQCTVLKDLICNDNNLQTIDFTTNTGLIYFEGNDNDLTSLDFSQNTNLDYFSVENNLLTSLDVSQNTNLKAFSVENNQITSLDLSLNVNLEEIICRDNALTSLNLKNGNNTNIDLVFINNNPGLTCVLVDDASYAFPFTIRDLQTQYNEVTCGIQVSPKVLLQGAAIDPITGEEDLMRDDLRVASLLPTTSPYSDGVSCNAAVFTVTGANAIVDWVWVELRDDIDLIAIKASQSALLQRDGDIVDLDGVSSLDFNLDADDYKVVIKHRNHLSIMTVNNVSLSKTATIVDFTDANDQITYGSNAQTTFGMQTDIVGMWTGNVNGDTLIQYSGTNPDAPDILATILNDSGNFLNFPTYILAGYKADDANMDGNTQYSGTNPDTPFILQNVLAHPGNFLNFSTYQIQEQLPTAN